jgi:hypothetical protein
MPGGAEFSHYPCGWLAGSLLPDVLSHLRLGTIGRHRFDVDQLDEMKQSCQKHCFSALNHNLAFCYNDARVLRWVIKQAARRFQGATGSFS